MVYGFGAFFNLLPGGDVSSLLLIYGFPITVSPPCSCCLPLSLRALSLVSQGSVCRRHRRRCCRFLLAWGPCCLPIAARVSLGCCCLIHPLLWDACCRSLC